MKAPELGLFTFDVSLGLEPKQTVPKTVVLPLHHETILVKLGLKVDTHLLYLVGVFLCGFICNHNLQDQP
jgi:hypothetical protein